MRAFLLGPLLVLALFSRTASVAAVNDATSSEAGVSTALATQKRLRHVAIKSMITERELSSHDEADGDDDNIEACPYQKNCGPGCYWHDHECEAGLLGFGGCEGCKKGGGCCSGGTVGCGWAQQPKCVDHNRKYYPCNCGKTTMIEASLQLNLQNCKRIRWWTRDPKSQTFQICGRLKGAMSTKFWTKCHEKTGQWWFEQKTDSCHRCCYDEWKNSPWPDTIECGGFCRCETLCGMFRHPGANSN